MVINEKDKIAHDKINVSRGIQENYVIEDIENVFSRLRSANISIVRPVEAISRTTTLHHAKDYRNHAR